MKTKSAVKKRFSVTGTGKLKRNFAYKRHCLFCKTQKMKRQARGSTLVADVDVKIVKQFLPYLQEYRRMSRVKRGVTAHARHKKVLSMAKGYRGRNKNVFRVAVEKVEKLYNMLIATDVLRKEISAACGFNVLTLPHVCMI